MAGDFELSGRYGVEVWVYRSRGEGGVFGIPAFGLECERGDVGGVVRGFFRIFVLVLV